MWINGLAAIMAQPPILHFNKRKLKSKHLLTHKKQYTYESKIFTYFKHSRIYSYDS